MSQISGYDRFLAMGGLSETDRKAWEEKHGTSIDTTDAPLSFREFFLMAQLGAADPGKGADLYDDGNPDSRLLDPTSSKNIRNIRTVMEANADGQLEAPPWTPTPYQPVGEDTSAPDSDGETPPPPDITAFTDKEEAGELDQNADTQAIEPASEQQSQAGDRVHDASGQNPLERLRERIEADVRQQDLRQTLANSVLELIDRAQRSR